MEVKTGNNRELPSGIEYPNGNLSFEEIHKRFAASGYGQKLQEEIRFKPYKTGSLTNDQWCRLLGADVNNLHHMSLTRGLAASLLRRIRHVGLSRFDLEVLLLTAQVHDWAEAVTGDINYDHKKKSDKEEEWRILTEMLGSFLPEDVGVEQPRGVAVLATLFDENYRLYPIFNIVEALGYVRTALNAYQRQHMVSDVEQKAKLAAMGHKVVASKLNKLYVAGKDYPVLHEYLLYHAELIGDVLDGCSVEIFQAHLPEHPDKEQHINAAMDGTLRARAAMRDLRERQRVSLGLSASPYRDHVPQCVQKPAEAEE